MIEYYDYRQTVQNGNIGILTASEKELLRDLAKKVKEIAQHPNQKEKVYLWKKHNSLQKVRPVILTFPEGAWQELIPYETMIIKDPYWKSYEYYLRRLIYRGEKIKDDNVIEAVIDIPFIYRNSGWGIEPAKARSSYERGAAAWEPVLKEYSDTEKLKYPEIIPDDTTSHRNLQTVGEILNDILPVKFKRKVYVDTSLIGTLVRWRGIEQLMLDMVDSPGWLHGVMDFMKQGTLALLDHIESNMEIDLNNGNDYVGSGGLGYTDELPSSGTTEEKVALKDLWGAAESQDFDIISPAMYDEFAVQYQIPLLERFGLNCYGCCESLNQKFDVVKKIPRLRRVSVSPWTDPARAVEALQDKYIFSWKPNPAQLVGGFDPRPLRNEIKRVLEVTKGCVVEMILKDTHTVENHPERILEWVNIARELATEGYM